MCLTEFCSDCMRWAVGSGYVTRMPKTNSQEELLFGDQEFFEPVNAAGNNAGLFSNVDKHFYINNQVVQKTR